MKHVIIGNGNLGQDFKNEILSRNIKDTLIPEGPSVLMLSSSTGWKYPVSIQPILDFNPDHVWVTVGAGSVDQAKKDYTTFSDLHIRLPAEMAQKLDPKVYLHLFSSDYVTAPTSSLYALSKFHMEQTLKLMNRPRTYIYRVGSLYGKHKPETCFPYKLKQNYLKNKDIKLPLNRVCPTPTDWLAQVLYNKSFYLDNEFKIIPVCPTGSTTVKAWGELILGVDISGNFFDENRPVDFGLELPEYLPCPSWLELWNANKI